MKKLLLMIGLLTASAFAANTCTSCYISSSLGSDSNSGASKSLPWAHAPGMKGCTGNCATQTAHAGDTYTMYGGDTWGSATQEWHWTFSGSSGSNIQVGGLDQTWYNASVCGASYCRPIINAQGVAVTGNGDSALNRQFFLDCGTCYVTVNEIEFTGVNLTANTSVGYCDGISACFNSASNNFVWENTYCHGWTHNGSSTGNESSCFNGDTGGPTGNSNSLFEYNSCDGSDTTEDTGECMHGGPDTVAYNYCNYVVSCIIDEASNIHDNYIQQIVNSYNGAHQNGIEINYVTSATCQIYNNVIGYVQVGLALWVAPESGTTCYVFNNVIYNQVYNSGTANTFDIAAALISPSGTVIADNNTMECGPDGDATAGHWNICAANIASSITAVTLENNHWITLQTSPNNGVWSVSGSTPVTETTDLKQLPATATAQGYTISETYPFSPTSGGSTIGAGTNLTSLCSGTLVPLCSDTTLGVSYSASHQVTSPRRMSNARPASGAWDQGAYKYLAVAGASIATQNTIRTANTIQQ